MDYSIPTNGKTPENYPLICVNPYWIVWTGSVLPIIGEKGYNVGDLVAGVGGFYCFSIFVVLQEGA